MHLITEELFGVGFKQESLGEKDVFPEAALRESTQGCAWCDSGTVIPRSYGNGACLE